MTRQRPRWTRYAIGTAVGTVIAVVLVFVGLFAVGFVQGLGETGAAKNSAFRDFFDEQRSTVCPPYVRAKGTPGAEAAESFALELLEGTYTGTWEQALGTKARRMLDTCEAGESQVESADEESASPPDAETPPPVTAAPPPTMTEAPAVTASTATPTTAKTTPGESFADLAASAHDVLGPLEMKDGTRFAVLVERGEQTPLATSFVKLAVEGPSRWDIRDEISIEGWPGLSTLGDVDGDGEPEILVDWLHGANGYSGILYRVEAGGPRLAAIPFAEEELDEPMLDYSITSVSPGAVTTTVESCEPSCADGRTYDVSWSYDPEARRLVPVDAGSSRAAKFIVATGTASNGEPFTWANCPAGVFNGHEAIVYECTASSQDNRGYDVAVSEQAGTGSLFITEATSAGSGTDVSACSSYSYQYELPLRLCDQGIGVSWLHSALSDRGYATAADDRFGPDTESAVVAFQRDNGLEADGVAGPATWRALGGGSGLPGWDLNGDGMITPDELGE